MPEISTASIGAFKAGLFASIFLFFEFFGIPQFAFTILGVLMLIDMITGITKQYAVNISGDKSHFVAITSHRWWFGIIKKVMTLLAICSIALAMTALDFDGSGFMLVAIAGFIMAEVYSIIQNVYIINTGKFLPEFNATGMLLRAISGFLRNRVEKEVEKIEGQVENNNSTQNENKAV